MNSANKTCVFVIKSIVLILLTTCSAATADDRVGPSMVPPGAGGFVHIQIGDLARSPAMAFPAQIAARIKKEADQLFERHTGVRVSELEEITVVLPSLRDVLLQGAKDFSGLAILTFARPYESEQIIDSLPDVWDVKQLGNEKVYTDKEQEIALFFNSSNSLVIGNNYAVEWFLDNRTRLVEGALSPALQFAQSGHLIVGFNGSVAVRQFKDQLPIEVRQVLDARSVAVNVEFDQGITARAQMDYASADEADDVASAVQSYMQIARAMLLQLASEAQQEIKHADFGGAMVQLIALATVRHGDAMLDDLQIDQQENRLQAQLHIDGIDSNTLVIASLTAIQWIGASSNAEFEDIARQLEQSRANVDP